MTDEELLRLAKEAIDAHLRTQRNITAGTNRALVVASNRITERLAK